ncbi:sensor histidine kinase [Runella sp.]|uniref:sensor histidine kinase n=1 Tax=Runella sp. TaxID=1960881 RepID=UPI003D11CDB7
MKTKTKIALIVGVAGIIIVILFGSAVYYFLNTYSYIDFYKRLEARVSISAKYNLEPNDLNAENLRILRNRHLEKLEREQEYLIEITPSLNLDSIFQKYGLPKEFIQTLLKAGKASEKQGSTFFVGSKYKKGNRQYLVIVSAENYYVSHHLHFLRNLLIGSVVLIMLVIISLSVYFSKHIFVPIKEITDRVKQISTENIHLRLDTRAYNNNNEIIELTNTFNDLLNRIETAFETQKNFISNASHELSTPLTSIIGEADVSLLKIRTPEDYQQSLQNILQQAERLDQITKSLLFLAQTGYKGKAIVFEMIRMDEIIWETKRLIDKLNPANKVFADLSLLPEDPKKLKVKGNRQLLQLAFSNLLMNACKYSNNSPVAIYIASSDTHVIITIKDEGIGIPESELPYIYDPFFRASNTKLFEGYGIGLPLARNVVNLHKGQLLVSSVVNVGTTVQIKLPLFQF